MIIYILLYDSIIITLTKSILILTNSTRIIYLLLVLKNLNNNVMITHTSTYIYIIRHLVNNKLN